MDINIENMKANSNDREYVLKTVKEQGKMLEFASSELQDDEEIVKVALTQDGEALEFASDRLKGKRHSIVSNKNSTMDSILCIRKTKSGQRAYNGKCKRLWTNFILC